MDVFSRYRKTIIQLFDKLHQAGEAPYDDINKWLEIQESLINKIIYVEKRIRKLKNKIKDLNYTRKNPNNRLTKFESNSIKSELKEYETDIEDYRQIISIYKSIGDGIAFTFFSKWDIKPQNFKQSPGFISMKKGLILEKKILRDSFKKGHIAILHDITSVLRYFDISVLTEDNHYFIEAKSSKLKNERVDRQEQNSKQLYDYLVEDTTENLYVEDSIKMKRINAMSPEVIYIEKFNQLLESSRKLGSDYVFYEDGFVCLIIHENSIDSPDEILDQALNKIGLKYPISFYLNSHKFIEQAYYPFTLLFKRSEDYIDFIEGRISIMIFLDFTTIQRISSENNYIVTLTNDEIWPLEFTCIDPSVEINKFKISIHYLSRTFMEMVSLEWLITDSLSMHNHKEIMKELESPTLSV